MRCLCALRWTACGDFLEARSGFAMDDVLSSQVIKPGTGKSDLWAGGYAKIALDKCVMQPITVISLIRRPGRALSVGPTVSTTIASYREVWLIRGAERDHPRRNLW